MENENKDLEYPKLRPVEAVPAQQNMICLRDPQGFSDKLVFLPQEAFYIVTLFDGNHSILDIQEAYTRRFGDLLFSDKVRELIDKLDSCLLLESDRFHEVRNRVIKEFNREKVRPATHAGAAYEEKEDKLREQIKGLFESPEGPGLPVVENPSGRLRGLIAPHIDVKRGGVCFAHSYNEYVKESSAKTVIILGIAHIQTKRRFVLTQKDFATPLGVMQADHDFIDGLSGRVKTNFFEDELVHRNEHSIEFQVLFLRYLYDKNDIKIVPILCSAREQDYLGGPLEEDGEFQDFIGGLREVISERTDEVCFIAGVDLSHLGQRFGQNITIDDTFLAWAKEKDTEMIKLILERDAEGFMGLIQGEKDSRNVCGVPAIYTMLKVLDAKSSKLIRYDQAVEDQTQSVVTFMGAGFYDG
ncbi:MAG: AmmeMemoRadiSam system protein B [Spirochaetota bacterium]|nr:MAG: AmmeMemoRadiSam system protein B [Spirochaetota bacterium]